MKIALIVASLLCMSTPAFAADTWKVLGADQDRMLALNVDSITRRGDQAFAFMSFAYAQPLEDGTYYSINYIEYDCPSEQFRHMTIRAFRFGRASNGVFDGYDWEPVEWGTWGHDAYLFVCGYEQPDLSRNVTYTDDQHEIPIRYIQAVRRGDFSY